MCLLHNWWIPGLRQHISYNKEYNGASVLEKDVPLSEKFDSAVWILIDRVDP